MQLRRLRPEDKETFYAAVRAFPDEEGFQFIPMLDPLKLSFEELLKKLEDLESDDRLTEGIVPGFLLFAFNEDGEIVGRCSIRFRLNEYLEKYAGHIGYGVVPKFRRQGYATRILKEALRICREELTLKRVLITCDDDNVGSIKTIENNGIREFTTYMNEKMTVPKRHYWVDL